MKGVGRKGDRRKETGERGWENGEARGGDGRRGTGEGE